MKQPLLYGRESLKLLANGSSSGNLVRTIIQLALLFACAVVTALFYERMQLMLRAQKLGRSHWGPTIIVITPTYPRQARIADMTRLSQTLALVNNLHWIVIEDGNTTVPAMEGILKRSKLPYYYFAATTEKGLPKRGWTHRSLALDYVRKHYANYSQGGVVYFADDDNAYDLRLFDRYIRKVKRIGVWAIGLVGSSMVEAPKVENGKFVGWNAEYNPGRIVSDMAGFAVNLKEVISHNASFGFQCKRQDPEPCYIKQYNVTKAELEPFGFNDHPKEVYVWHTKTRHRGKRDKRTGGYLVEGIGKPK